MLDPNDIKLIGKLLMQNNKELRKAIREEIESESENIRSEIESRMMDHKVYLSGKIDSVSNQVKNVEIKTKKILTSHQKMDKFLDKEHMHTVKRVRRIEEVLELPPLPQTK